MPDALLKINGHQSRDHTSLSSTGSDAKGVLSEEQEAKTPTAPDDSGIDNDKLSVCI